MKQNKLTIIECIRKIHITKENYAMQMNNYRIQMKSIQYKNSIIEVKWKTLQKNEKCTI